MLTPIFTNQPCTEWSYRSRQVQRLSPISPSPGVIPERRPLPRSRSPAPPAPPACGAFYFPHSRKIEAPISPARNLGPRSVLPIRGCRRAPYQGGAFHAPLGIPGCCASRAPLSTPDPRGCRIAPLPRSCVSGRGAHVTPIHHPGEGRDPGRAASAGRDTSQPRHRHSNETGFRVFRRAAPLTATPNSR